MDLKVVIIGAGIGGLCLANRLVSCGVRVELFERDISPFARQQGYRLHLDADGVGALRKALPDKQFALFEATSMVPLRYTTIMETDFSIRRRFSSDEYSKTTRHVDEGIATHLNVNRATLREILLLGLKTNVHFGKKLAYYIELVDHVTAYFEDGTSVDANILVGADGANSIVRSQRLPNAPWMDSGARSIYGRISLDASRRYMPAHILADVFSAVSDNRKLIFGAGPMIFPIAPDLAARTLAPEFSLSPVTDYMGCIVAARREFFGDDRALREMDSGQLQSLASRLVAGWPAGVSTAIDLAERESFFFVEMSSSIPFTISPPSKITLLGDAIHAMTPSLGRGANVALRDAALLAETIVALKSCPQDIAAALSSYETEMAAHGFSDVRHSAEMGTRLLGQDSLPE